MNYDIKIKGDKIDNGTIELDQLATIAKTTKDIAQKALMLKIFGFSNLKLPVNLKPSLKIRLQKLSGNKTQGTHLLLDTDPIGKKIKQLQLDAFKPELLNDLETLTPMALVILTFRAALTEEGEKNNLDKPLLKTLMLFKKSFTSEKEVFSFSNRQSIPAIEVKLSDFKKIELLDDSIPEPNKVVITGRVDEMKYSKSRLVIVTDDGPVNVLVNDDKLFAELKDYFGKDCTIQGMANYRVGGMLSFIEMQGFGQPSSNDKYFSKLPKGMSAKQQIMFQAKEGKVANPLTAIAGQWPGKETDEEFDELLKSID